eukprot:6204475-Pleurochrysis_carterae.AAC.2
MVNSLEQVAHQCARTSNTAGHHIKVCLAECVICESCHARARHHLVGRSQVTAAGRGGPLQAHSFHIVDQRSGCGRAFGRKHILPFSNTQVAKQFHKKLFSAGTYCSVAKFAAPRVTRYCCSSRHKFELWNCMCKSEFSSFMIRCR